MYCPLPAGRGTRLPIPVRLFQAVLTLRQAALALGSVTEEQFDSIVRPETMIGNGLAGA